MSEADLETMIGHRLSKIYTRTGASANLVVAGFAERAGQPIRFVQYTLMAFPIMLLSIVISMVDLYWRYL